MTASLVLNVDLGNYSNALGAAQRLANGNYSFDSGWQGQAPKFFAQAIEVRPDGSKAYVLQANQREYRNFRIQTLYEGVSDQLAASSGETSPRGQGQPDGGRHRGNGADTAEGSEASASPGGGASAPRAVAGNSPDDFRPEVAAALTASSRPLALPPKPTAPASEDVRRLDQLFTAGLNDGTSFLLPRSRREPWSFAHEDGAEATF